MNNKFQISNQIINNVKLPDAFVGFKILHMSDLHSKVFGKGNYKLLAGIERVNPDIIVMTGDIINARNDDGNISLELIKSLKRIYPIYYIMGNHEQKNLQKTPNSFENYLKKLLDLGVIVLDDSYITIKRKEDIINIYGLTIDLAFYWNLDKRDRAKNFSCDNIVKDLGKCNREEYNILLVHDPKHFEIYAEWGADLILSGHVHGGIIRLPFIGGLLSPDRSFFPKYDSGLYDNKFSKMIVSRGLGNSTLDFRLFNKPELVEIVLKK